MKGPLQHDYVFIYSLGQSQVCYLLTSLLLSVTDPLGQNNSMVIPTALQNHMHLAISFFIPNMGILKNNAL